MLSGAERRRLALEAQLRYFSDRHREFQQLAILQMKQEAHQDAMAKGGEGGVHHAPFQGTFGDNKNIQPESDQYSARCMIMQKQLVALSLFVVDPPLRRNLHQTAERRTPTHPREIPIAWGG